jgi:excisionase family DNA binding protein
VEDKLFSIKEAAKYLGGVSVWTLYAWISKGRLAKTKVGARTMIRESALQALLADCNPHSQPLQTSPTAVPKGLGEKCQ